MVQHIALDVYLSLCFDRMRSDFDDDDNKCALTQTDILTTQVTKRKPERERRVLTNADMKK